MAFWLKLNYIFHCKINSYAKVCLFYAYKIVIKKSKKYIWMLTNIQIYWKFEYSLLEQILKSQYLYEINTYDTTSGSTDS